MSFPWLRRGVEIFVAIDSSSRALDELRASAAGCRACDLWKVGTQTVFGEGAPEARLMLVGEQPGDREDRAGAPFVGPAGKVLDRALAAAEIDRGAVYLTNVVKHFKWRRPSGGGTRRIHDKPTWRQIGACLPWLESELEVVRPELVVCLGATAAQALLGRDFRVTSDRGRVLESALAPRVLATVHPSSILRAPDAPARATQLDHFVHDLRVAARALADGHRRSRRRVPGDSDRARAGSKTPAQPQRGTRQA